MPDLRFGRARVRLGKPDQPVRIGLRMAENFAVRYWTRRSILEGAATPRCELGGKELHTPSSQATTPHWNTYRSDATNEQGKTRATQVPSATLWAKRTTCAHAPSAEGSEGREVGGACSSSRANAVLELPWTQLGRVREKADLMRAGAPPVEPPLPKPSLQLPRGVIAAC
jgi:hypothetical protein